MNTHIRALTYSALLMVAVPVCGPAQSTERRIERTVERVVESATRTAERLAEQIARQFEDWDHRQRDDRWQDQDFISRIDTTISFSPNGTIDLSTISGEIIVNGWSRNEARIRAYSERGQLRFSASSSRIMIEAQSRRGRMGETKYELSVPQGVRLVLQSTSGRVTARDVNGPADVRTTSGDIALHGATGSIELSTTSGDIDASRLRGDIEVDAVSGEFNVTDAEGTIRVETVSSDISLRNLRVRDATASTVSGEIEYEGSIARDGRYDFRSHSGNVTVRIPANTNAQFQVETYSGELDSDFPITLMPGDRSRSRPRRFEFNIGSGGTRIIAETFSGDIVLERAGISR
ncbi:MAG TPA: DUF4097 family beta strand repeat-containing protein [Gemmatimonadaceae bacterium]|nr:DUF4097 family beta strand repeat-containing protein [Gemmatimonadaceae bacterium]